MEASAPIETILFALVRAVLLMRELTLDELLKYFQVQLAVLLRPVHRVRVVSQRYQIRFVFARQPLDNNHGTRCLYIVCEWTKIIK